MLPYQNGLKPLAHVPAPHAPCRTPHAALPLSRTVKVQPGSPLASPVTVHGNPRLLSSPRRIPHGKCVYDAEYSFSARFPASSNQGRNIASLFSLI